MMFQKCVFKELGREVNATTGRSPYHLNLAAAVAPQASEMRPEKQSPPSSPFSNEGRESFERGEQVLAAWVDEHVLKDL